MHPSIRSRSLEPSILAPDPAATPAWAPASCAPPASAHLDPEAPPSSGLLADYCDVSGGGWGRPPPAGHASAGPPPGDLGAAVDFLEARLGPRPRPSGRRRGAAAEHAHAVADAPLAAPMLAPRDPATPTGLSLVGASWISSPVRLAVSARGPDPEGGERQALTEVVEAAVARGGSRFRLLSALSRLDGATVFLPTSVANDVLRVAVEVGVLIGRRAYGGARRAVLGWWSAQGPSRRGGPAVLAALNLWRRLADSSEPAGADAAYGALVRLLDALRWKARED